MILLGDLRRMIAGRLDAPCMLRICRDDGCLFVTDFPARRPERSGDAERLLKGDGWAVSRAGSLWRLDPGPALWGQIIESVPKEELPDPSSVSLALYSAARRLTGADVPAGLQPVLPLRVVLKAVDAGDADRVLRFLPAFLSALQREKKPLPQAAGRLIVWALNRRLF